ncbi:MAG: hypothetical protein ACJ8IR_02875 [Alphaproteobacteria bacterium]|jgi:hypothetical protein
MAENSTGHWMARGPLGIIARFISLIYAISALLLAASVTQLSQGNKTLLICFIVLFPFAVLIMFSWLVAGHHKKLYAPSDFRSDESFFRIADIEPPVNLARKPIAELADTDFHGAAGDNAVSKCLD